MAKSARLCFHKQRKCLFCRVGVGGTAPVRAQRRCSCCGCFVGAVERCKTCITRGFRALRLFV